MERIYTDQDADPSILKGETIAVIGYGSQGRAHASNLRDSGCTVVVGARPDGSAEDRALSDGFRVVVPAEAAREASLLALLTPDMSHREVYEKVIAPNLSPGAALLVAHGFSVHYGEVDPRPDIDVVLVAPKGPGDLVRREYEIGRGVPCLFAVQQDASGEARARALAYARGIGGTAAGAIETDFAEETETDLFGEQAVLCGGASALVKAGFQTLVDAGYQPEIAYFECLHELKLIVDLMYRGGLNYMRYSVSDTAEHGDYTGGPRIVTEATRQTMRQMLAEIQNGTYARTWIEENAKGRPAFTATREAEQQQLLEQVGARLREMMPFLDPVSAKPSDQASPTTG